MKNIITLVAIFALVFAAFPVLAAGNGATKVDLMPYAPPLDEAVGTVVFNTTASGYLNILINIDDVVMEDYDLRIIVRDEDGPVLYNMVYNDVLSTNAKGQGNIKFQLGPDDGLVLPDDDEYVRAQVTVREDIPGPNPYYETEGGLSDVALK